MTENKNMISFIIPLYNAAEYVSSCIDAILQQKYSNWELIIVDDGSTDNSLDICMNYAYKDNRIKVVSEENSGSAVARNRGLAEASGEWIAFIDADDFINDDYLDKLVPKLSYKYDFVMFSYNEINGVNSIDMRNSQEEILIDSKKLGLLTKDVIDTERRLFELYSSRSQVWTKLYKKSFLDDNNISFDPKLRMCQDVMFNLKVYMHAKTAIYLPYNIYNYRILQGSTCHKYSSNQVERIIELTRIMDDYVINNYLDSDSKLLMDKRKLVSLVNCCRLDFCHKDNPKSYKDRCKSFQELRQQDIFKEAINISVIKDFSFKKQICMWLVKFNWFWAINLYLRR